MVRACKARPADAGSWFGTMSRRSRWNLPVCCDAICAPASSVAEVWLGNASAANRPITSLGWIPRQRAAGHVTQK